MSKAPSMPMYWDAYLADTTHLTTEEHGAYILLLAAMWRRNGWVPDDDKDNARILGMTVAKWRRVKARLSGFLIFENGEISQKKLLEIWKKTQEKIAKNVKNGAKGGRAKSSKNNDISQANATNSLKRNASIPEPEPEPDKKERDTNVSLRRETANEAVSIFNKIATSAGWPTVRLISEPRIASVNARIKELGGMDGWREFIAKASTGPHLCGENDRGWTADFDWLTKPKHMARVLEGNYDRKQPQRPNGRDAAAEIARAASAGAWDAHGHDGQEVRPLRLGSDGNADPHGPDSGLDGCAPRLSVV